MKRKAKLNNKIVLEKKSCNWNDLLKIENIFQINTESKNFSKDINKEKDENLGIINKENILKNYNNDKKIINKISDEPKYLINNNYK